MRLYVDNAADVSFQHSTCGSSKLLGVFNLHDKWVRALKDETKVNAMCVPTERNLADMMTKGLTAEVRAKLHQCLMDIAEAVASGNASNNVEVGKIKKIVQIKKKKMVAK